MDVISQHLALVDRNMEQTEKSIDATSVILTRISSIRDSWREKIDNTMSLLNSTTATQKKHK